MNTVILEIEPAKYVPYTYLFVMIHWWYIKYNPTLVSSIPRCPFPKWATPETVHMVPYFFFLKRIAAEGEREREREMNIYYFCLFTLESSHIIKLILCISNWKLSSRIFFDREIRWERISRHRTTLGPGKSRPVKKI